MKLHPKDLKIADYTYELPDERVAKYPLPQRDASKLLIFKNGNITEDVYANIAVHIPDNTLLVFNQTRVIHARLLFRKPSGGVVQVFCLEPHEQYPDVATAMLQKGKVMWRCMIGGASKWKHGMVLSQSFDGFCLNAAIAERQTGSFTLELNWDNPELTFAEVLHVAGLVPLPPYLHREAEQTDEERYQTIYAREEGSVAAPTAGLHFTEEVMQSLVGKNAHIGFVTLHVGAGTFKPVKSATMEAHEMHAEWIEVTGDMVQSLIAHLEAGIVAVGTTSLRTLESLYWIGVKLLQHTVPDFAGIAVGQWDPYQHDATNITAAHALQTVYDWMLHNGQQRLVTRTQILIAPGYRMQVARGLITNFHQPASTLLLLVAALIGDDWSKVYNYALKHDFRFLSYGDGSLLWGVD